jgi:DNA modification methylase
MQATVLCGSCIDLIPSLGKFDFIFADPPFNIGHPYIGYKDSRPDFDTFTAQWIYACWDALSDDGVLCLHGNDELAVKYVQNAVTFSMKRIAWILWHYRFGQCGRSNWINGHAHCLVFAKSKDFTWNPEAVLVPSDRASIYGDRRIDDYDNGGMRLPGTVWGVPSDGEFWGRVQGNNQERRKGHPNQLPENYLRRLILAYTNPGDRVLDPFGGSGTTIVVANALGRNCTTIDISKETCKSIEERIAKGAMFPARNQDPIVPVVRKRRKRSAVK